MEGNLLRVNELLAGSSGKLDINQPDHKGRTPLVYAVGSRKAGTELVRALLRHGAVIDQASVQCALSDLQKLTLLIDAGADVLYQRDEGYDALINAAYGWDALNNPELLDILRLLILKGVSLRGMTTYGESAVRVLSRIGRFDAVQLLLKSGANPDDVKFTPLIEAIAFGSLADVATTASSADLEERDYWERTPWLIAIQTGDIAKATLLLERGADRNATGRCKKPSLLYAIESGHIPMLEWLLELGTDLEQTDEFGHTALRAAVECCNEHAVEILLHAGANVDRESHTGTALGYVRTRRIAMKLLDAGADPQHLPAAGRRAILGYPPEPDQDLLEISETDFAQFHSRRFGTSNPELMSNPFWEGMIRSGINAWRAAKLFGGTESFDGKQMPTWCAERFGQSLTFLPDGRIVQVAGEHEDYYDPDFCIYNDVFVHAPDGSITIYGYPESVFPPTDFHTATLIGDYIYLIGSLAYPAGRRYGETPVYRLDTTTFEITHVQTTGESPGWIYKHRAAQSGSTEITVSGGEVLSQADGQVTASKNDRFYVLDFERHVWRSESRT
jgi:ankyrin repeat protein